jgi:hypothetical protein
VLTLFSCELLLFAIPWTATRSHMRNRKTTCCSESHHSQEVACQHTITIGGLEARNCSNGSANGTISGTRFMHALPWCMKRLWLRR